MRYEAYDSFGLRTIIRIFRKSKTRVCKECCKIILFIVICQAIPSIFDACNDNKMLARA